MFQSTSGARLTLTFYIKKCFKFLFKSGFHLSQLNDARGPNKKPSQRTCPCGNYDILSESAIQSILQWLMVKNSNMVSLKRFGPDVRRIPSAHTFQQSVPMDFNAHVSSGLSSAYIQGALETWPDQELKGFLLDGVDFRADLPL